MIARLLFELAKRPPLDRIVGLGFAYGTPLLPVRRLLVTHEVIVFQHPRPVWPGHLLIVPRSPLRTLLDLAAPEHRALFTPLTRAAQTTIRRLGLDQQGYVLLANGGPRQEVPQVHFHLFTDRAPVTAVAGDPPACDGAPEAGVVVVPHPRPTEPLHLLLSPHPEQPPLSRLDEYGLRALPALLAPLSRLEAEHRLTARGYSLVMAETDDASRRRLTLHLIAGAPATGPSPRG
jgi:diadenosine tetraphosphate (Ap4A) HIT family hydrolase